VSGVLAWYSTIHVPPPELDRVLAKFRRLLTSSGVLVVGFFDSDDGVPSSSTRSSLPTAGRSTSSPST